MAPAVIPATSHAIPSPTVVVVGAGCLKILLAGNCTIVGAGGAKREQQAGRVVEGGWGGVGTRWLAGWRSWLGLGPVRVCPTAPTLVVIYVGVFVWDFRCRASGKSSKPSQTTREPSGGAFGVHSGCFVGGGLWWVGGGFFEGRPGQMIAPGLGLDAASTGPLPVTLSGGHGRWGIASACRGKIRGCWRCRPLAVEEAFALGPDGCLVVAVKIRDGRNRVRTIFSGQRWQRWPRGIFAGTGGRLSLLLGYKPGLNKWP